MKVHHFAYLLLFQILFACNEPEVFQSAPNITDSLQKIHSNKPGTTNIVFTSTDGGQSWRNMSEGLPGDKLEGSLFVNDRGLYLRSGKYIYHNKPNNKTAFWEKEVFPDDHSSIAPGRSRLFAYDYHQGQFRQKINGSDKWLTIYENFKLQGIIDVLETAVGTVFIVCDRGRGLYRSTDNGQSWKEVTRGVWKLVESTGVLMANSINGVIRSTDDGQTWETAISEGGMGIHLAPIDGGFAAITYNTDSKTRRVRTSYDAGKTWQAIDAGLPPSLKTSSIVQVGEHFFCGHPNGIYRSVDKGKTWQLIVSSIENKVFNLFVSGNVLYAIPSSGGC